MFTAQLKNAGKPKRTQRDKNFVWKGLEVAGIKNAVSKKLESEDLFEDPIADH